MNNKCFSKSSLASALIILTTLLSACQPQSETAEAEAAASADAAPAIPAVPSAATPIEHSMVALPGLENAVPLLTEKTSIRMQTTAGDLLIEIYPQAAPNAAARFIELVETGYFDNTPISRVVPGFVAQFGINWRDGHKDWQDNNFNDDPTLFALDRGTLAFAKAGPDTNSTQVFINYVNNNRLASAQYNFTAFGKVVQGMEFVDQFLQVGDPSGGLSQARLWDDGEAYLAEQAVMPSFIQKAELIAQ